MGYSHYLSDLTKYIETIAIVGGYPFLFITVLLEGLPLLGTLSPGHISIIVAGFLIKVGVFNVWITLILAIVAAVFGDYIGFYLGRKYGMHLIDRVKPYFFITDEHIAKVQSLISNHLGKAMILGRLSPITRALMPFVVGANHTSEKRFWHFNIIGGTAWAVGSIAIGYIFGAGYQASAGSIGKFIFISICAAIAIAWGYRFVNLQFHIFKKYELFVLFINLISLGGLAMMMQDIWTSHSPLVNFDIAVSMFVFKNVTPLMTMIAGWTSDIVGTVFMVVLSIIGVSLMIYKKKWRSLFIFFTSMASTAAAVSFLKEFFMRVRPCTDAIVGVCPTDPSFPSGHASLAAAFYLIAAYLILPRINSWVKRELTLVLCVLLAAAIGVSRVVLNVHWTSDVIAGWSLGLFCASSSILLVRYVGGIIHKQIIE
jgi:membrane protein DedA with SNARE-associated domain/membrane-associated phospholipid phosphatase